MQQPETEQGHWGKDVKTHVGAAWLDGVTDESLLLVTEEGEASQQLHQQAQEQHQHPPGFTCSDEKNVTNCPRMIVKIVKLFKQNCELSDTEPTRTWFNKTLKKKKGSFLEHICGGTVV